MFIMRIWVQKGEEEEGNIGQIAMRGKVQHILGEEVHSFQNWASLVDAIRGMLIPPQGPDARAPSAHK
jgi:hypothetical protein